MLPSQYTITIHLHQLALNLKGGNALVCSGRKQTAITLDYILHYYFEVPITDNACFLLNTLIHMHSDSITAGILYYYSIMHRPVPYLDFS